VRDQTSCLARRVFVRVFVVLGLAGGVGACVSPPDDVDGARGAILDICATAPEGALCDDKNVCTILDVCKAGVCKGSAAPDGTLCTDGNVCTANDSCRAGVCKGDAVPDLTPCTDGDPCTVGDACHTGACVPGAGTLSCDDGIACTLDMCVAGLGCLSAPVGDCNVPKKDAGADADAADGPSAGDAASDAAGDAKSDVMSDATGDLADVSTSGADAPSDRFDAPASTDAPFDMAPFDVAMEEAPPLDARADLTGDVGGVAVDGGDAGGTGDAASDANDGGVAPDAAIDAADADAASPLPDAAADASSPDAVVTLPVLRASGGACTCTAADGRPGAVVPLSVALMALAVVLARGRRRRSR
jgi:hypothetical protein